MFYLAKKLNLNKMAYSIKSYSAKRKSITQPGKRLFAFVSLRIDR